MRCKNKCLPRLAHCAGRIRPRCHANEEACRIYYPTSVAAVAAAVAILVVVVCLFSNDSRDRCKERHANSKMNVAKTETSPSDKRTPPAKRRQLGSKTWVQKFGIAIAHQINGMQEARQEVQINTDSRAFSCKYFTYIPVCVSSSCSVLCSWLPTADLVNYLAFKGT